MSFTLDTWKESIKKNLDGWRVRMRETGVESIYSFVSASALLPLIQAVSGGELVAIAELGRLTSSLGTSLLASKLQNWKNESDAAKKIESEIESNLDLRKELDEVLKKLKALPLAIEAVKGDDREWFKQTLHGELDRMGNLDNFRNVIIQGPDTVTPSALRDAYLNRLFEKCRQLSLSGVDPQAATGHKGAQQLSLDAVYTALLTLTSEEHEHLLQERAPQREIQRQSALEQLNRHPKLVLLGDPGSGKSTFVNFVALCMAGALLDKEKINLDLLVSPLPNEDVEGNTPQAWDHQALIPVRIILRDFAARGLPHVGEKATAVHLWDFIASELESATLKDYCKPLQDELLNKGGILLLDGLDEVPEAEKRRAQIKESVEDFASVYYKCRIIVTSRTYAYQKQDWRLLEFTETILAPFSNEQINFFIKNWYVHSAHVRGKNIKEAEGRADLLKCVIFKSDRLRALAERPLLLTLMASLHAWRGGNLPEKREELYADTVDLLLERWQSPKTVLKGDGTVSVVQPALAEWLKVERDKMRRFLNELAFNVHTSQPDVMGTADITEKDLVGGLMKLSNNPDVNPAMLIEFLIDRAGLLLPRGVHVYTFPHRTFQEYLSACYLTDNDFPGKVTKLVRKEPNRWREVALLACAKAVRGTASIVWPFVDKMCYCKPEDISKNIEDIWGAQIAAQALVECVDLKEINDSKVVDDADMKKVLRLKHCLQEIISVDELPPGERAAAGVNFAHLGDPRPGVTSIEGMEFCHVPEGSFIMGSRKEEDPDAFQDEYSGEALTIPEFYISRFPVTVEQFRAFVEADGYANGEYWTGAGWEWKSRKSISGPREYGSPFSLANHPVVGISWYEALAFTRWLNGKWHEERILPDTMMVTLPSEAEWEKAARGGTEIPGNAVIASIGDLGESVCPPSDTNPAPGRIYPWDGSGADRNRANYDDTGIGATSAVGCFPGGVSPYGCEEMSGNVWEWTRSIWGKDFSTPEYKYPYKPDDGREDLEAAKEKSRVLRGGSFDDTHGDVRCAGRNRSYPGYRSRSVGFRVLLSPF